MSSSALQPSTAAPLLRTDGLAVDYAAADGAIVRALQGVSFSIGNSEALGVLGESGSGKSSLALALLRLLPANAKVAGVIDFQGREVFRLKASELRRVRGAEIALISQEPALALNPVLTIGRQVGDVLRAHSPESGARQRERVREILEEVGFEDPDRVMRAYPHQISGGQRQRAAIAQALVCRPSLLIADEPLSSLDTVTQAELLELLGRLRFEMNLAMLFISHDASAIRAVCKRALVLREGRLAASGSVEHLRASTDPYVRGLQFPEQEIGKRELQCAATSALPVLEVRNLSKRYLQRHVFSRKKFVVQALEGINFSLAPGVSIAVIGRSGSGKSTLARCIAGFETPDSGEVLLEGRPHKLNSAVQMIFQDSATALNPRFTALQLVAEPLEIARQGNAAERSRKALALMEEVGLSRESQSRIAAEFSGGQRQRLALARALAADPKVLVLDESLAGLDLPLQAQMLRLLMDLQSRRRLAYVFISHDLKFIPLIADLVMVMDQGKIIDRIHSCTFKESSHPITRMLVEADAKAAVLP